MLVLTANGGGGIWLPEPFSKPAALVVGGCGSEAMALGSAIIAGLEAE